MDLTQGNITKQLIEFSLPIFAANILQLLYNTADVIILDRFIGSVGITAANIGGQVMLLATIFSTGLSTGGTVVISQYFGKKDKEGVGRSLFAVFIMCVILAVMITGITLAACTQIISLLNTPSEAVEPATDYLYFAAFGTIAIFGYNAICAAMRGMGDSRSPLYVIGICAAMNIVLDLVLIAHFHMGAGGAAIATSISQALSFIIALVILLRNNKDMGFRLSEWREGFREIPVIARVGLPSAFQSLSVRISMVVVLAIANLNGSVAAAAFGIGVKLDSYSLLTRQAISAGITAMVGQNKGIGNNQRIESAVRTGACINLAQAVVLVTLLQLFAAPVASIFTKDALVVEEVVHYIRIAALAYLPMSLMTSYNSLPIGIGFSEYALFNSFLDSILVRIPLCWLLSIYFGMGMTGLYIGLALSPVAAMITGCLYYHRGNWRDRILLKK